MRSDSLSTAKTANSKESDSASPSRSVQPVRVGPETDLNLLRRTVQRAACDGCAPSAEGIAAELARLPPHQRASAVMGMQQTLGNARVGRLAVQAKLKLGPAGDKYEQEADRVAQQVVETISSSDQGAVQRQEDLEDEEEPELEEVLDEEEELQRKVDVSYAVGSTEVRPDLESTIQRVTAKGKRPNNISLILARNRWRRKNRKFGLKFQKWKQGYEAQHVIPYAVAVKFNMPMKFINDYWNCMMLPSGRRTAPPIRYKKKGKRPYHIKKGLAHPHYNRKVTTWIESHYKSHASGKKKWNESVMHKIADKLREATKKLNPSNAVDDIVLS